MNIKKAFQRFFVPSFVTSGIYAIKFKCMVSPRAEVDYSPTLTIGKGTQIAAFTRIKATDGTLIIGSHVSIGSNCFISAHSGGVQIGDYTMFGPNVSVVGNSYKYDRFDIPMCMQEKTSKGIKIGNDVWLGAGSIILDGVTIHEGAIVGAGAVVTKDVAKNTVVAGVPAKIVSQRT